MRKVTEKAAIALREGKEMTSGNTKVVNFMKGNTLYEMQLHDNVIAQHMMNEGKLYLYDCGWQTSTTKERLNGILEEFNLEWRIYQLKGQWYMTDGMGIRKDWTGSETFEI